MAINQGMDKQMVTYPYSGILLSNIRKWAIDILMSECQNTYAEWKEPD